MDRLMKLCFKLIVLVIFFSLWKFINEKESIINMEYIHLYMALIMGSLFSDRIFFNGQHTENNNKYLPTSNFLVFTWFLTLTIPLIEYVYFIRYDLKITRLGVTLVILGIVIRGIGIKTLGKFFSCHVETWSNHKIIKVGIYKYIRHPAYAGNILQAIGLPLVLNSYYSMFLSVITIGVFLWRINVEEEFLMGIFPDYKKYMNETKRILPWIW